MSNDKPRVGLGVVIENGKGQILVMKREGSHAPFWSIPGGKLELGETFEEGIVRELREELDIEANDPQVIAITNNLKTYELEGLHFISVILKVASFTGEPRIMEPHKCTEIKWVNPAKLPQPHFDASELGVKCYIRKITYVRA